MNYYCYEPDYRNEIEARFRARMATIRGVLMGKDTVLEPKLLERFGGFFPFTEEELFLKEKLKQREPEFFRTRGLV